MNWAEYVLNIPKTLEQRRLEDSIQYKKEKENAYRKKRKSKNKVVRKLLEI